MPFLIETFDKPDHAHVRARERDAHLAFLARHRALLLACGAKLDDDGAAASGGIYIVDVETREAAERFIAADPFTLAGLFERVAIVRWRKAYVDGVCHL
ncbi:YciI family protein [Burkholderia multivorans]|uniref:YciI family protein n=1 Tax=Burkholderia multivorans TaxID=87883 RepID=UPI00143ED2D4|nr:YciI family protein [Burkholderia multivorans]MBU9465400.1 YciI family protein [Burkholderia multivorans]MCA8126297.1 YciI family protein [Burkholderia multivorans]QIX14970.1 YciI family protein [Burkholderia multivorans]